LYLHSSYQNPEISESTQYSIPPTAGRIPIVTVSFGILERSNSTKRNTHAAPTQSPHHGAPADVSRFCERQRGILGPRLPEGLFRERTPAIVLRFRLPLHRARLHAVALGANHDPPAQGLSHGTGSTQN
jgi:hypothetical protein